MATSLYRKKGEQFFDNAGNRLIAGKIYYYQAGTTTLEPTYSDQGGNTANTNPLILNGDGRLDNPVYLGSDNDYKELVVDSSDTTIDPWPFDNIPKAVDNSTSVVGFTKNLIAWQQVTSAQSPKTLSPDDAGSGFEIDLSGGNVVINLPSAASTGNGKGFFFKIVDIGSGGNILTINADGTDLIDGGASVSSVALNFAMQMAANGADWDIVSGYQAQAPRNTPTGRLTPTTGVPVLASEVTAATTIYYTAYEGNTIPIWNGSTFLFLTFSSDLTLPLTSSAASGTIVDVFAFDNAGALKLGWGPAWSTATAGSGARGTGAGTTELTRTNGLWTNKNSITLLNSSDSFTVAAEQATYLGSLFIDGSAGQVTCHLTYGQSRKWGIWNAYNRKKINLKAGDSTSSWSVAGGGSFRAANGSSSNSLSVFTGLAEEPAKTEAFLRCVGVTDNNNNSVTVGIGVNSTTAASGFAPDIGHPADTTIFNLASLSSGRFVVQPSLGVNTITILEKLGSGAPTASGGEANMLLSAEYWG